MIETHPDRAKPDSDFSENVREKRTPRTIRFSESEWKRIKTAATERAISVGGFVRDAALAHATAHSGKRSILVSPTIEEVIM